MKDPHIWKDISKTVQILQEIIKEQREEINRLEKTVEMLIRQLKSANPQEISTKE